MGKKLFISTFKSPKRDNCHGVMFTRRLFIAKKIIKTTDNLNKAFEL